MNKDKVISVLSKVFLVFLLLSYVIEVNYLTFILYNLVIGLYVAKTYYAQDKSSKSAYILIGLWIISLISIFYRFFKWQCVIIIKLNNYHKELVAGFDKV